ncbi:S-methyl-5-thioribose-1-phosphate isomerase [Dehalobacterium formicoaceticum]|uniref:Methylthioribose-1-phosphate isomerase n=1 Tax=Dehalobacterium formicoaceticum TaxID=51515 RepID=A0ABT1Y2N0_9FIRM|nr:S-methyl-5-thioribose-1-phosphate isomerase [Dehalobacterium formicoaceticum]MCR6544209.1 S-methyl-5-thioribose-1-phosphate isomerase [Dehalobacterium formicoaceticum]
MLETMRWADHQLILLDQTKLPGEVCYFTCTNYQDVVDAIKRLVVRGAPAIGAAAAYGMVLAAWSGSQKDSAAFHEELGHAARELAASRPTAVNLFWALDRMKQRINPAQAPAMIYQTLLEEAHGILREDLILNQKMGRLGQELIPQAGSILTHCNAGALATGGYGTALGVIRAAHEAGKKVQVFADETRPLLQGARLTAFELMEENIPVTLITDSMAGSVMQKGWVDLVLVGADRITANGDVANKIGTYSLAVLAHAHGIPFYVAAPVSTFDLTLAAGEDIPIEERSPEEVRNIFGFQSAPLDVPVFNPAFDVTPHHLISAIITEKGIIHHPDQEIIKKIIL